jgi:hypothetical protein
LSLETDLIADLGCVASLPAVVSRSKHTTMFLGGEMIRAQGTVHFFYWELFFVGLGREQGALRCVRKRDCDRDLYDDD